MGRDIHPMRRLWSSFADGSFITDKGRYDVNTGKFYGAPGQTVEPGYVEEMCAVVAAKFYASAKILKPITTPG